MQLFRAILLSASLTFSLQSTATTLNFNELSVASRIGTTYASDGFILSGQKGGYDDFFDQFFVLGDTGSPALIFGRVNAPIDLRSDTSGLFNAISIDIARGDSNRGLIPVGFVGTKESGAKVYSTYWFPDSEIGRAQTFTFGGDFVGLTALDWYQGAEYHQFDNIVLSAVASVPEPSTLWLLSPLVLGLCLWERKRARKSMANKYLCRPDDDQISPASVSTCL